MAEPTHSCPGGCGAQVQRHLLACKQCWSRLPAPLRNAVTSGWRQRRRDPAPHRLALRAASDWYRDNPPLGAGRG